MNLSVPHPLEILHGGGVALACGGDAQLAAEELHGLFAGDTRVLSTYRVAIAGHAWRVLARSRSGPSSAQWELQNPPIRATDGELAEGTLHLRIHRRVDRALHDCLSVHPFVRRPVRARLTLLLDADFADLFEVKERALQPRLAIERVLEPGGMTLRYVRRGFVRGLVVRIDPSGGEVTFSGGRILFDLELAPGRPWRCCLEATPLVGAHLLRFGRGLHAPDEEVAPEARRPLLRADPLLERPFTRGRSDLERLTIEEGEGPPLVAAGAPWFMALFGRDALVTSLMTGLLGAPIARGVLEAVGRLQATGYDDFRDAQPGKLPHELRHGELASFGEVPHTPYYGAHDAPALYVLALWQAWRWTADRALLERHLPCARRAMAWCEGDGDPDRDGLLEYRTRSPLGYRNQGWKDAGDAIVHADGTLAEPPVATVELQGYLFAARLALAELLEAAGEAAEPARLRGEAAALRRRVEERFWIDELRYYALALDGGKRPVRSLASNPGHLLWCGLPDAARAHALAAHLLGPQLFSGFGLRTLAADHVAFNPLSYQVGSVWPHDTLLAAAGLMRYGLREQAARLIEALLRAAAIFDQHRLPELFCGLEADGGAPVPYERANCPQAWAAAAPILVAQLLLGLVPDAPRARCSLDPWLPGWLPTLELRGIALGASALDVRIVRTTDGTARVEQADCPGVDVVVDQPEAPLWGAPPRLAGG